jgi:amyloid beta precursor protein binding protein 1
MEAQTIDKKKEEKYDRQLRLWGADGQGRLERAKVCLINACATGTEILKNLVLPGIGSFTIVDGHEVQASDLGNNFFLDFASLGKSRAEATTVLLKELNEFVNGTAVDKDAEAIIEEDVSFFARFSLVIATNLSEKALLKLANFLYEQHIPLFVCRSYGFVGYLRLAVPEHTIVESKPDDAPDDMRLYEPWAELVKFGEAINMDELDSHHHSHVPFIVLLVKQMQKWRAEHGGKAPETKEDKALFKEQLRDGQVESVETNYDEAIGAAYKAWTPFSIPYDVQAVLDDPKARDPSPAHSSDFWLVAAAIARFVDKHHVLPLMGSIPDMNADTNTYVALLQVYQEKAVADAAEVANILRELAPMRDISDDYVRHVCRNSLFLRVLRIRSLAQEYDPATAHAAELGEALSDPEGNLQWYVVLRAVDRFYAAHGRLPGWTNDQVLSDVPLLTEQVEGLLKELSLDTSLVSEAVVHETCRFGGSELHNVAALMGGVGSQEAIKVITTQWLPINNTFVYNGINSTTTSLEL